MQLALPHPILASQGIYVRDMKSGTVRSVMGETYMLAPDEELWEKPLPPLVLEKLQALPRDNKVRAVAPRDPTRVVTYNVPHNCVVQLYDYKSKKPRIAFGPDLVMLGPEEEFTVLKLSGGRPKEPGKIKSLCLSLGPDFMTDLVQVVLFAFRITAMRGPQSHKATVLAGEAVG